MRPFGPVERALCNSSNDPNLSEFFIHMFDSFIVVASVLPLGMKSQKLVGTLNFYSTRGRAFFSALAPVKTLTRSTVEGVVLFQLIIISFPHRTGGRVVYVHSRFGTRFRIRKLLKIGTSCSSALFSFFG